MRFQAEIERRLRRFQSQQSAADDRAPLRLLRVLDDGIQVFDRAVDKDSLLVEAGHGRHKRVRTGRHDDDVVLDLDTFLRPHDFLFAIDRTRAVAEMNLDVVISIPIHPRDHQLLGIAVSEEARQADAVVGGTRLFAEGHDAELLGLIELDQLLAEALANHAVADHDHGLLREYRLGIHRIGFVRCRFHVSTDLVRRVQLHDRDSLKSKLRATHETWLATYVPKREP